MREDAKGGKSRVQTRSGRVRWEHFDAGLFRHYGYSVPAKVYPTKGIEYQLDPRGADELEEEPWLLVDDVQSETARVYASLVDYRLILEFARLASAPSQSAAIDFIQEFGWITGRQMCMSQAGILKGHGERERAIRKELRDFWLTAKLHNAVVAASGDYPPGPGPTMTRAEARAWLRSIVFGEEGSRIAVEIQGEPPYETPSGFPLQVSVVASDRVRPSLLRVLSLERPIDVVRALVHIRIQEKCENGYSFVPFWNPSDPDRTEFRVMPDNLIAAIYLELSMLWFRDRKVLNACANTDCPRGGLFVPQRRDQKYCSVGCKDRMAKLRRSARLARASGND